MANDAIKWLSTSDTSKQVAINWPTGVTTLSDNFQVNGTTNFSGLVKINGSTVLSGSSWAGGTIPVNKGGTGATSLSSGYALIGNGTSAVSLREIKNNTTAGDLGWVSKTSSTELINTNTLAYWNGEYKSGSSNLSKLGTITDGIWQASPIAIDYGGTGVTNLEDLKATIGIFNKSISASSSVTFEFSSSPAYRGLLITNGAAASQKGCFIISRSGTGTISIVNVQTASGLTITEDDINGKITITDTAGYTVRCTFINGAGSVSVPS